MDLKLNEYVLIDSKIKYPYQANRYHDLITNLTEHRKTQTNPQEISDVNRLIHTYKNHLNIILDFLAHKNDELKEELKEKILKRK